MAEESNAGQGQGTASQQNANTNVPSGNSASTGLKNTNNFLKGLKTYDAFQKDASELTKKQETPAVTPPAKPAVETPAGTTKTTEPPAAKPGEPAQAEAGKTTPPAKTEEEIEIETSLFGKQKVGKNKKDEAANTVEFKEFSDIEAYVKSNYGVEDYKKFLTEVAPKWREQATKASEFQKKATDFEKFFQGMPEKLWNAVMAYDQGHDWEESIKVAPGLKYDKKVGDYKKQDLVDHYFPGKFNKDDFDSDQENKMLDVAYDAAKGYFERDKKDFDGKRTQMVETQKKQLEAYQKSISSSADHLKKTLPLVSDIAVNETSKVLEGGARSILAEFVNDDGTLREDAALRLSMAKHGLQTLQAYMKLATNKTETEVREEFVSRAPDKLPSQQGGGQNKLSEKAKKSLSVLDGINKKRTF